MKGSHSCFIILALCFCLLACQPPLALRIVASPSVNPNPDGQPQPVVVLVYELRTKRPFLEASYHDLVSNPSQILGNSFITQHETILSPGSVRRLSFPRHEQTRYLGLVLLVRIPKAKQWRTLIELPHSAAALISDITVIAKQPLEVETPKWWQKIKFFGPKVPA